MKLYKSFLLVAAFAGLFTSCSEDGYWDAYDTTSENTYSFAQSQNDYVLSAADKLPQVVVSVQRNNNKTNDTIPLNVTFSSDIMSADVNAAIFEAGKYTTDFVINIDEENITMGKKYTAVVEFLVDSVNFYEHNYSISGNNSFTLTFSKDYTWKYIGKAIYTDDVVDSPGFGLPESPTYEVETEQAVENPGMIRLKNAYGAIYPYNAPGDYDTKKDYYITFNAEDPNGVYIDGWCEMGMDWGYGMFSMTSYGYYMMANGYSFEEVKDAGFMGTFDADLCITFPVKGLVMQMADWGMAYANKKGEFKLDLSTTDLITE